MAGALSGHLIDTHNPNSPFNSSIVSHGAMSFNPMMHGTPYAQQSFSLFNSQSSFLNPNASITEETAKRIATLQVKLDQKLGPEFISQRPGPGGGPKLTYVEGWKIINLANEVFGFNGWSSSIVSLTTDFADYSEETRRYCVGVTAIMRVTLRDGVHHEDIGYGMLENAKSKGAALDKCKKEAVTDGLKRALRNFGNVLGNCLYDKAYTSEIVKVKFEPVKFKKDDLHRRPEFDDVKPNVSSSSAASTSAGPSSHSIPRAPVPNQHTTSTITPTRPPMQQNHAKPLISLPSHMRSEVEVLASTSTSTSNSTTNHTIHYASDVKGESPRYSHQQSASFNTTSTSHQHPAQRSNVPQQQQRQPPDRHVSFSESNHPPPVAKPSAQTAPQVKPETDGDDSFGFNSDDDAFLALADLGPPIGANDADIGRPIESDLDTGRPIDHDEGLLRSVEDENIDHHSEHVQNATRPTLPSSRTDPNAPKSRHELIAAALQGELDNTTAQGHPQSKPLASSSGSAMGILSKPVQQTRSNIPTTSSTSSSTSSMGPPPPPHHYNTASRTTSFAQQQHQRYTIQKQKQNQKSIPQNQHASSADAGVKRASTPSMGGFHFPPGVNPVQPGASAGSGVSIGVKRPAEAMRSTSLRGSGPGMGVQQAISGVGVNGKREVLGSLDIGEGGDVKRRRR